MREEGFLILFIGLMLIVIIWGRAIVKVGKSQYISKSREAIKSIFAIYFTMVLWLTFSGVFNYNLGLDANLIPIVKSIEMLEANLTIALYQILGNLFMLIPLGFILPTLYRSCRTILKTGSIGFLISLVIEVSQCILGRVADIDDLILNTLGALIGYFIYKIVSKMIEKKIDSIILKKLSKDNGIKRNLIPVVVIFFVGIYLTGVQNIYLFLKLNCVEVNSIQYKIEEDGYKIKKENRDVYGNDRFLSENLDGSLKLSTYNDENSKKIRLKKEEYIFDFSESMITQGIEYLRNIYKDEENFIRYEFQYSVEGKQIKYITLYGKVSKGNKIKFQSEYGNFEYEPNEEYLLEDINLEHLNLGADAIKNHDILFDISIE